MAAEYRSLDPFASPAFKALREYVLERRDAGVNAGSSFEEFEAGLMERVMAVASDLTAQQLARYEVEAAEVEFQGEPFRFKMKWQQEYSGIAGKFLVERSIYVPRSREGKAICPLEIRAGIVEGGWTPLAARLMSRAVASTTPKEAATLIAEWGGMKPSSSSLDRLPKALSAKWETERQAFEAELRSQEQIPREAVAVGVSLDGVLVPLKKGEYAEEAEEEQPKTQKRSQGPAGYKEVGCGTMSFYDADGERLETVRYARMPEPKKADLKSELEAELQSVFSVRPDLQLVLLADGAVDNWTFLEGLPKRLGRVRDPGKEAVDLFHVLERVKKALDAYYGEDSSDSRAEFARMRIWLREQDDGAERVLRGLRYRRKRSTGSTKKTIAAQIKYFEKRKERMRYKQLLDQKLPVGSGVVEAACKTLASERMKRSGMSWRAEGGQAILTFRSLIQSNRWNRGWQLLSGLYRGEVTITKRVA
jgi:hypothetical protein